MIRPDTKTKPILSPGKAVTMPEFIPVVRPEDFYNLRVNECHESMSQFGIRLKKALDPDAKDPFNKQYVDMIEKGKTRITEELQAAFFVIAGTIDGMPEGVGGAVRVEVLALPNQIVPGSFIPTNYESVKCNYPGCPVIFVKPKWSKQKYHSSECKKKMDSLRKKHAKQNGLNAHQRKHQEAEAK